MRDFCFPFAYRIAMALSATGPAQALARLPLLAGVQANVLARLASHARWVEAEPGEMVVDFDDPTTDVFFVLQGGVRVLVRTADGERTQILGDFAAGDMVGEMSAIDDAPRSARVDALVRTRLCVVPASAFLELLFTARSAGLQVMRLLTSRIREQNRRLLENAALPIRLRLVSELLRLGRPRPDGAKAVTPPPTQEELAARIGTRRETVSREMAALVREGLLRRTRGSCVLPDPAALRAMVEAGLEQPRGNGR